jgi:hypothetical protein
MHQPTNGRKRWRYHEVQRLWRATPDQLDRLQELGFQVQAPLTREEAAVMIRRAISDRKNRPATPRQEALLRRHGFWQEGMTITEASSLIDQIFAGT